MRCQTGPLLRVAATIGLALLALITASRGPDAGVAVLEAATCPAPQGYWKNNPNAWPVSSLVLGDETYTKAELLAILNSPGGGTPA